MSVASSADPDIIIPPLKSIRVIPFFKYSGAVNMSLDYLFTAEMQQSDIPVLRFYGWKPYCLSLGKNQTEETLDIGMLEKNGFDAVRRPTGGSAILHSEELTYSFVLPLRNFNHHQFYDAFHKSLAAALNKLGFPVSLHREHDRENYLKKGTQSFACFNRPAFSEIKYDGKKVVGSAQRIREGILLQHGSILIGQKQMDIINLLRISDENKIIHLKELVDKSIALNQISTIPVTPCQIGEALIVELEQSWNLAIQYRYVSESEMSKAQEYVPRFSIFSTEKKLI